MVARSLVFITALVVSGECAFGKKKEKFGIEDDEVPLTDARDYELENMARHKAGMRPAASKLGCVALLFLRVYTPTLTVVRTYGHTSSMDG